MINKFPALVRLARPRQWIKNGFVAAPLFFTPEAVNVRNLGLVAAAVAMFCLLSSAIYAFNDWCDRTADREHPSKRSRPIASGAVSPGLALVWAALLFAAGVALALFLLPTPAFALAVAYVAMSVLYSAGLKHIAILDVLIVAAGFVLRLEVGGAAVGRSSARPCRP